MADTSATSGIHRQSDDSRQPHVGARADEHEHASTSDEDLAVAALEDRAAFSVLYRRYVQRVYSYFTWKFGPVVAEDLTSDVFTRALRLADRFQPGRSWRAWLFGIARNRAMEHSRERQRHDRKPPESETVTDDSPERSAIESQEAEVVRTLLSSLSDREREVIELRFWADLSYREVSKIVNRSEGALRVEVHRALRSLRRALEERSDVS